MVDVLLVSKPIVPPLHDSSKNLVRDLATHMQRHTPIVLSQPGVRLDMPRARIEPIYSAAAAGFSPTLRDNARVLWRLLSARRDPEWASGRLGHRAIAYPGQWRRKGASR